METCLSVCGFDDPACDGGSSQQQEEIVPVRIFWPATAPYYDALHGAELLIAVPQTSSLSAVYSLAVVAGQGCYTFTVLDGGMALAFSSLLIPSAA